MVREKDKKEFLNVVETSRLLGVAVGTLNNWRCRREGPQYLKLGGKVVRYALDDVLQWLKNRKIKTRDTINE